MRKPILIVGLFVLVATVALVYAIQAMSPDSIPLSVKRYIPRTNNSQTVSSTNSNVQFEWKLANPYLLKDSAGDVYLDLRITGKALPNVDRKRMNLVLVIDRSGSMADQNKLDQVKNAATSILNSMNPTDRLAIVIYDDAVQTLLSSTLVENKEQIRNSIYALYPGGGTNLYAGLEQGLREARKNFDKTCVNRIILLSDGLANVGISDPEQIGLLARRIRESSISVSTMGVGTEYNENLMANVADFSGGNYYYISNDVNMAEIFRREWNLMQSLVATDALATLRLNEGVKVLDVTGYKWETSAGKVRIQIPDIYSGEAKRVLVHLHAPANAIRTIDLAQAEFECSDITGKSPKQFTHYFQPAIRVIADQQLVRKNYDRDVQAKVASVEANLAMEEAYRKLEAGDQAGAYEVVQQAAEDLRGLGYVANEKQLQRYEGFAARIAPSSPVSEPARKDLLKKNKEAERNSAQSSAQ